MEPQLKCEEPIVFQMMGEEDLLPLPAAKEWMARNDKRLKPHVVTVPKTWWKAVVPGYRFPRDCFGRAIYFLHQSPHLPNALYVLGATIGGGFGQHGWVEIEDRVVFDGVMQQFYDKAGYYAAESATPWYRFTRPAVMFVNRKMMRDSSLSYRWHCVLGLPWARDPTNPLLVDLERAKEGLKRRTVREIGIVQEQESTAAVPPSDHRGSPLKTAPRRKVLA